MSTIHARTCHICEANCGVLVEVEDREILSIKGNADHVLSRGHICPKATAIADLQDDQILEGASRNAVLSGANLAKVGDELLQFCRVEEIAPRRWRLSELLRGRRGTEAAMAGHTSGEHFILLEPEAVMPFDVALDRLGAVVNVKAAGPGDSLPAMVAESTRVTGGSLKPLSPVHIDMQRSGAGDLHFSWIRRSRQGFGWPDHVDAPLAEGRERYRLTVSAGGRDAGYVVDAASFTLSAEEQLADFGAPLQTGTLTIAQVSDQVGPGTATTIHF